MLSSAHVQAMADAIGIPLIADDLGEITHRLNAFLDALAPLATLPLDGIEPRPVADEAR